jgi:hypothetical protein
MEFRRTGTIVKGLGGASGRGSGGVGTITRQAKFFDEAGVPRAKQWFQGTININLSCEFEIVRPDHVVTARWHPDFPTHEETFWLVDMTLEFRGARYPAYLYYPLPSGAKVHPDSTMEVLTQPIEGVSYGDQATVIIPDGRVRLKPRA